MTFEINDNGILHVSAKEKTIGKEQTIAIHYDTGRLTEKDIERLIADAKRYKAEDEANKNLIKAKVGLKNYCFSLEASIKSGEAYMNRIEAKTCLENCCFSLKSKIKSLKSTITVTQANCVDAAVMRALKFAENSHLAELHQYKAKQAELEVLAKCILGPNV